LAIDESPALRMELSAVKKIIGRPDETAQPGGGRGRMYAKKNVLIFVFFELE
jgi:hypothetical protein